MGYIHFGITMITISVVGLPGHYIDYTGKVSHYMPRKAAPTFAARRLRAASLRIWVGIGSRLCRIVLAGN